MAMRHTILHLTLGFGLLGCSDLESISNPDPTELDPTELARFRLGHRLFFDPGLSGAGDVSCASCHKADAFGADGLTRSEGTGGAIGRRNAPSVFNAALKRLQFWDGRAETLEEQATGPLFAADEMGHAQDGLLEYVRDVWGDEFRQAFSGEAGPTIEQVTAALAAYQEMLPRRSRFDRFLDGDRDALDREERRGYRIFRRSCEFCHTGAGVGGTELRKLGEEVPWPDDRRDDQGRFEVTGDPDDRMVFMVPSLRNVAETGPWFHDGSVESLEEAVRLMGRHQLDRSFTGAQSAALVAFLNTLTAEDVQPWAYEDWDGELE
ncbi:MAG: cytochrome C biogenesis protein CcsA [Deltaproteobacteria bacterium]|nr:cytochrome C biogenesis protein CcsA [Nannocystaceae bacterium]